MRYEHSAILAQRPAPAVRAADVWPTLALIDLLGTLYIAIHINAYVGWGLTVALLTFALLPAKTDIGTPSQRMYRLGPLLLRGDDETDRYYDARSQ